uniref:hypothetical protein n=1 Tax=Chryseobacterium sp. TaxID=1871047 RepID=UPI0025C2C7B4
AIAQTGQNSKIDNSLSSNFPPVVDIVKKNIQSMGGERLSQIKSMTTIDTKMINGELIERIQKKDSDGNNHVTRFDEEIKRSGRLVSKLSRFFNNNDGQFLFPIFNILNNHTKYTVSGIEKVNGKECYVIEGGNYKLYLDKESGLTQKAVEGNGYILEYSNFKAVNGLTLPHKIILNNGQEEFNLSAITFDDVTDTDFCY